MAISSTLLGIDFPVKTGYTYITRFLINEDEEQSSRLKITFNRGNPFPFMLYMRQTSEDGTVSPKEYFTRKITSLESDFEFTCPPLTQYIMIMEISADIDYAVYNPSFTIELIEVKNQILTDMYMYETKSGLPYRPHELANYSTYEFIDNPKLKSKSDYVGKNVISKMVISDHHENERGYIDRIYVTPKIGKVHNKEYIKDKTLDNEEHLVYLDTLDGTKNIMSQSNHVLQGVMFKTDDKPPELGSITFRYVTTDNREALDSRPISQRTKYPEEELFQETTYNDVIVASGRPERTYLWANDPDDLSDDICYGLAKTDFIDRVRYVKGMPNPITYYYYIVFVNYLVEYRGKYQGIEYSMYPQKFMNQTALSYQIPQWMKEENGLVYPPTIGPNFYDEETQLRWKILEPEDIKLSTLGVFDYNLQNFVQPPNEYTKYTYKVEPMEMTLSLQACKGDSTNPTAIKGIESDILKQYRAARVTVNRNDLVPFEVVEFVDEPDVPYILNEETLEPILKTYYFDKIQYHNQLVHVCYIKSPVLTINHISQNNMINITTTHNVMKGNVEDYILPDIIFDTYGAQYKAIYCEINGEEKSCNTEFNITSDTTINIIYTYKYCNYRVKLVDMNNDVISTNGLQAIVQGQTQLWWISINPTILTIYPTMKLKDESGNIIDDNITRTEVTLYEWPFLSAVAPKVLVHINDQNVRDIEYRLETQLGEYEGYPDFGVLERSLEKENETVLITIKYRKLNLI